MPSTLVSPVAPPRPRLSRLVAWALALPLLAPLPPAKAGTVLSYISSPYSYVSGGETVSVGTENGTLIGVYGHPSHTLTFSIDQPGTQEAMGRWWYLLLSPPAGTTLSPGAFDNASRWSFQDPTAPGLDFYGNGRGNNTLSGGFRIWEATYTDAGSVLSFAADFLQYDGQDLNSWTKGAIRFNSAVPIQLTPEPVVHPDPILVVDPPWNPGYTPDPDGAHPVAGPTEPFEPSEPIVLLPWPVEGGPADGGPNAPISLFPYPEENGAWQGHWSSGSSSFNSSVESSVTIQEFTPYAAPGPLPIAGAIAGWHSARRLRRRCRKDASGAQALPRQARL